MTREELPHRTAGDTGIPRYRTTLPSVALLIRVAKDLDEWAERDRDEHMTTK